MGAQDIDKALIKLEKKDGIKWTVSDKLLGVLSEDFSINCVLHVLGNMRRNNLIYFKKVNRSNIDKILKECKISLNNVSQRQLSKGFFIYRVRLE